MLKIDQYLRKNNYHSNDFFTNFLLFYREYFIDSKKTNDEHRKPHGASSHSNADLITNHLNETTAASKTNTGTPQ